MRRTIILAAAGLICTAAYAQADNGASPQGAGDKPIGGAINANGTPQISPTKFTVTHPTTGRYVIKFKTAFSKSAICVYQPIGAGVRVGSAGVNSTTCDVTFFSLTTNQAADTLFTFVAVNAG